MRQSVLDIVRERAWPARYTGRVLKNAFIAEWLGRETELKEAQTEVVRYREASAAGDASVMATIVGEGIGLIHAVEPAAVILERMVAEAEALLKGAPRYVDPA